MAGTVWVVSGSPGAGKSSVCRALLARCRFGLHLPVDDLRELVVSGIAHPGMAPDPEAARQFDLARRAASHHARLYAEAGFTVAIDDVLWPQDAAWLRSRLEGLPLRLVFLATRLETALARNAARTGKPFDPSDLAGLIAALHPGLAQADYAGAGWTVLDTSALTLEDTVDRLLETR